MPRRTRWALQRRWKRSLAALALLLALGQAPALAATLTVTTTDPNINGDGQCALIEAIENANADAQTHIDCPAGSGADVIALPATTTHTLTAIHNTTYGATGLPSISSTLTIECAGSTIARDPGDPGLFRLFAVNSTGNLTLNACTVSGGTATDDGGILVYSGTLTLTNSTVSGNSAAGGGGVFNFDGLTVIEHNTLTGSTAPADQGGGVASFGDGDTLTRVRASISANLTTRGC